MNDWRKRLAGERASPRVRSAFSSPASSCRRIAGELGSRGAPGRAGPQSGKRGLQLGGKPWVPCPDGLFHLLECHVGVEGAGARRVVASPGQGVGRLHLGTNQIEQTGGHRPPALAGERTHRRRPSPERRARSFPATASAARIESSLSLPVVGNAREAGTSPAGRGSRSVLA